MDLTKEDIITVDLTSMGTLDPYYGAVPPNVAIMDSTNWTVNNGGYNITIEDPQPKSTLTLKGEDADIMINGESLMTMIRGIQDRLNMLSPDPGMEQEWEELATIRKMYDRKLAECRAKSKVWNTLKSMPPPETE